MSGEVMRRRCMPLAQWPSADAAAWSASLVAGDPFAPGGVASRWSPKTQRQVVVSYGRWLRWLEDQGMLDQDVEPADRVTRERVTDYTRDLAVKLSPFTVAMYVQLLADGLRAMAGDHDWGWIARAPGRIREQGVARTEKRSRLQTPDRIAELGMRLMEVADTNIDGDAVEAATLFRNGLTMAVLAYRPIRMSNLESMTIGVHLLQTGDVWRVAFPAEEVKNDRPLEFPFPTVLVPYLERYLSTHRPVLLEGGTERHTPCSGPLWVSRKGHQLGYQTIGHHIQKLTKAEFGAPINAHLFRDCAATMIAIVDPEHAPIIASILGHASMRTSERHYNQARDLDAGRRYEGTVRELRKTRKRARQRHPDDWVGPAATRAA
jgi:integrase